MAARIPSGKVLGSLMTGTAIGYGVSKLTQDASKDAKKNKEDPQDLKIETSKEQVKNTK